MWELSQFGVTMAVAVVISSVSALTLVPALSVIILRPASTTRSEKSFNGRVRAAYNASFSAVLGKYTVLSLPLSIQSIMQS